MNADFNCDWFEKELQPLQQSMLLLEKDTAGPGFEKFYQKGLGFFNNLLEIHNEFQHGHKKYVIKKQCQLILHYLDDLLLANVKLAKKNEEEIIELFEKQYKLKKIVRHLQKHL